METLRCQRCGLDVQVAAPGQVRCPACDGPLTSAGVPRDAAAPASAPPPVELACQQTGRSFVILVLPADLGREAQGAEVLTAEQISRRHCRLELLEGVPAVRDLGSRHGTFVEVAGVRCPCTEPVALADGARLWLGREEFLVRLRNVPRAPTVAPAMSSPLPPDPVASGRHCPHCGVEVAPDATLCPAKHFIT